MNYFNKIKTQKYLKLIPEDISSLLFLSTKSSIAATGRIDPSVLYVDLGIKKNSYYSDSTEPFSTKVSYYTLSPFQRYCYLEYLQDPLSFKSKNNTNLSLFTMSLERALNEGNFQNAFDMFDSLRITHIDNKAFIKHTNALLIKACILKKKYDHLEQIFVNWDVFGTPTFPFDLLVLAKGLLDDIITASDIIDYQHLFFNRTLSCSQERSAKLLSEQLQKYFGTPYFEASNFLPESASLAISEIEVYSNSCLSNNKIRVPHFSESPLLQESLRICFESIEETLRQEEEKKKQDAEEQMEKWKRAGLKKSDVTYSICGADLSENEKIFFEAYTSALDGIVPIEKIKLTQGNMHLWFHYGINTIGGVKLRGRKYKLYSPFLDRPRDIESIDEAISDVKSWAAYVAQQIKRGKYVIFDD